MGLKMRIEFSDKEIEAISRYDHLNLFINFISHNFEQLFYNATRGYLFQILRDKLVELNYDFIYNDEFDPFAGFYCEYILSKNGKRIIFNNMIDRNDFDRNGSTGLYIIFDKFEKYDLQYYIDRCEEFVNEN